VILATRPNAAALLTFVVAALLTALVVPLVRRLGLRWGLTDQPDPRKQHTTPMVRLGGVGIVLGFSAALTLTWLLGGFAELEVSKDQQIWTTLAGSLCFFFIGLADDLFALPPLPRLAGQLAVSMVVWHEGVRIGTVELPLDWLGHSSPQLALPDPLSLLATLIWLVGITNAINWLDGLDGLAAGVSGIAAVGLISVSFSLHQPAAGLLAAALAGGCLGFLRHNFNPARIFMGDGGSYFLGFALAAISIVGPAKGLTSVSLLLPLLILSLPLADHGAPERGSLALLSRPSPPASPPAAQWPQPPAHRVADLRLQPVARCPRPGAGECRTPLPLAGAGHGCAGLGFGEHAPRSAARPERLTATAASTDER
jgi:UDP-N-acetylmuramyl pentapeptide phosphotransferase/UDP-N-acetylglucosamine-1-phosphate transferase